LVDNSRYCSVVNTHATYHDVCSIFLASYLKYAAGIKLFVFSNEAIKLDDANGIHLIKYFSDNFRDQYLEALLKVPHDYVLTFNDDYFLTGIPEYTEILECIDILETSAYSHIRFVRGPNFSTNSIYPNLYSLDINKPFFYSQTLSLWKRKELIRLFEAVKPSGIGRKGRELQFEVLANEACKQIGLTGLIYYKNEKKVGAAHYECSVVPHIVSAIVDGHWNTKEYSRELFMLENDLSLKLNPKRFRKSFFSKLGEFLR